jgi:DNA mismatch repair protein MutL
MLSPLRLFLVMNRIKILPEAVINKIAAGEVVERPASVVKELLENALDAGATAIKVMIKGEGLKSIRVEDDGEGMSKDDILLAFERHSTSKLRHFSDLGKLATLGFRGEALPSIAGVSQVELTSRPEGNLIAYRIHLAGGAIKDLAEVGAPPGTTVEVKKLFFNTPARRKFLKSPSTEIGHIVQAVHSAALANPGVAFRLDKDGENVLDVPAAEGVRERVDDLWGKKFADDLIFLERKEKDLRFFGFICPADVAATRRKGFYSFVNGRPVRDKVIFAALIEGYGPLLPRRRYPMGVLFLEIDGSLVDVNIHPTKSEVRFSYPGKVRSLVAEAVREALRKARPVHSFFPPVIGPPVAKLGERRENFKGAQGEILLPVASPDEASPAPEGGKEFRVLGQVKNTYIIVEVPEGMLIIDQHAAHERVIYEQLRKAFREDRIEIQSLLSPIPLELGPRETARLEEKISLLASLGVMIEPFGKDGFAITSLPSLLAIRDKENLVLDLIGSIEDRAKNPEDPRDSIIIRLACAAAVKARSVFSRLELDKLVGDLLECETPGVCPHGRPTMLKLDREELERRFGRR